MAKEVYESRAIINKIQATSRVSIKVKDTFYTIEYTEERLIPPDEDGFVTDIATERQILWDTVNSEVDNQVQDILALNN